MSAEIETKYRAHELVEFEGVETQDVYIDVEDKTIQVVGWVPLDYLRSLVEQLDATAPSESGEKG